MKPLRELEDIDLARPYSVGLACEPAYFFFKFLIHDSFPRRLTT